MEIQVEFFPRLEGSMTSPDGQVFMFKINRKDGTELFLGFPHQEIPNIVECAAMQMDHGSDTAGEKIVSGIRDLILRACRWERGSNSLVPDRERKRPHQFHFADRHDPSAT
jgi:hypothetical protein